MDHSSYPDSLIVSILRDVRRIALVGASANEERPSHGVMRFLLRKGYDVVPINPGLEGKELLGQRVVGKLKDVDGPIDMVDVFRASDALPGLVDEILQLQPLPKVIWTQLGVFDLPAAHKAEAAGLKVVMNRCPAIEMPRLGL